MLGTFLAIADFEYLSDLCFNFQSIPQFFQSPKKKKEFSNFRTAADPQSRAYLPSVPLVQPHPQDLCISNMCVRVQIRMPMQAVGGGRWVVCGRRQAAAAVAQLGGGIVATPRPTPTPTASATPSIAATKATNAATAVTVTVFASVCVSISVSVAVSLSAVVSVASERFVIVPRFLNLRSANATYFTYGICVNVHLQTTSVGRH